MSELAPVQSALCRAKVKAANIIEYAGAAYWMAGHDQFTRDYLVNLVIENFDDLSAEIEQIRAAVNSKKTEEAAA